jgi:hypothetical protein
MFYLYNMSVYKNIYRNFNININIDKNILLKSIVVYYVDNKLYLRYKKII